MQYLFDTNTISYLLDNQSKFHTKIVKKIIQLSNESKIYISVISLYEIEYGIASAKNNIQRKQYQIAKNLLANFFETENWT